MVRRFITSKFCKAMKRNYIEPKTESTEVSITSLLSISELSTDPTQTSETMDVKENCFNDEDNSLGYSLW